MRKRFVLAAVAAVAALAVVWSVNTLAKPCLLYTSPSPRDS